MCGNSIFANGVRSDNGKSAYYVQSGCPMTNQDISTVLAHVEAAAQKPVEDAELLTPAIVQMTSRGVAPEAVAALLGISVGAVRRVSITTKTWLTDDDVMADNMRNLLGLAYSRAVEVFQFGPQAEQASLTRLLLAYALKSISGESTSEYDEIRTEFETALGNMRDRTVDNGSGTGPSFINAFDSNEGFDD